jgi:hypothetical protein
MNKNKNKPLLAMDDLEFRRTMDDVGSRITEGVLQEARSRDKSFLLVAAAVLTLRSGAKRVPYAIDDDDGGADVVATVVQEAQPHLKDGEKLETEFVELSIDLEAEWNVRPVVPEHLGSARGDPFGGAAIIKRYRKETSVIMNVAVLTLPSGEKRPTHYGTEYSSEESAIRSFIREARRTKMLKRHETLSHAQLTVTRLRDGWVARCTWKKI